jgi:hypothetical protein
MLALAALAVLAAPGMFSKGLAPVDAGVRDPAQLSAAACQRCHGGAHAEWAQSRHAAAWTNAIFQREYQTRPLEWCVHCHAPLAEQRAEVRAKVSFASAALAREGVTCAVCHVRGGKIHAARKRAGSPHDVVLRPEMTGAAFCAGCHQFEFPDIDRAGRVVRYTGTPMQDTVAQFERGPERDRPGACRGCHAAGPGKHAYAGAHDPGMLERALRMTVCRREGAVEVGVANVGAGHNVPTGDVHRHLVLRAWWSSAPERTFELVFGRLFEPLESGGKRLVSDTTLPAGGSRTTRVALASLGEPDGAEPLNVELRYVYVIDDRPEPRAPLSVPAFAVVAHVRQPPARLPACK